MINLDEINKQIPGEENLIDGQYHSFCSKNKEFLVRAVDGGASAIFEIELWDMDCCIANLCISNYVSPSGDNDFDSVGLNIWTDNYKDLFILQEFIKFLHILNIYAEFSLLIESIDKRLSERILKMKEFTEKEE